MIKILFFSDIVGRPGRAAVKRFLEENKSKLQPDLVIANADNIASGRGPTAKTVEEIIDVGVDVLTCGDHVYDQKEAPLILQDSDKLIRPLNYPASDPGSGYIIRKIQDTDVLIVNLLGRVWTAEGLDSPFTAMDELLKEHKEKVVIVDFHAEATSEKIALSYDLAGKVSAIIGTHTHVMTADEQIIKKHTAMISDSGFNGPHESVIGVVPDQSIYRFRTAMPITFELAEGPVQVNAVLLEIDEKTGAAKTISRIQEIFNI